MAKAKRQEKIAQRDEEREALLAVLGRLNLSPDQLKNYLKKKGIGSVEKMTNGGLENFINMILNDPRMSAQPVGGGISPPPIQPGPFSPDQLALSKVGAMTGGLQLQNVKLLLHKLSRPRVERITIIS